MLPDEIFDSPVLEPMISLYKELGYSIIAVQRLSGREIERYGAILPQKIGEGVYRVLDTVEKPSLEEAPSDLGIVGRYILTPKVFSALEKTPVGKGREIQLTDGLRIFLSQEPIYAYEYRGVRYDAVSPSAGSNL